MNIERPQFKPFDPLGEESATAQRWERWLRSFELFLEASAIQNHRRKRALLLHHAGESVQEIWYTLAESKEPEDPQTDVYEVCKQALTKLFQPKKNYTYERHVFRSLSQKNDETVTQFVTRLKAQSVNCNFKGNENDMIIDQLIEKCKSNELRRQLLKQGDNLTVEAATELGRVMEASESQADMMEANKSTEEIHRIANQKMACYRCGSVAHKANDTNCPARKKTCNTCGLVGHFGKYCRTKRNNYVAADQKPEIKKNRVRSLQEETDQKANASNDEFAFQIRDGEDPSDIDALLGGVQMRFLIDSGATCNVIDKKTWEVLKEKRIKATCQKADRQLFPYGGETALKMLGSFSTHIKLKNGKTSKDTFYVVDVKGVPVIGRHLARELGILKTGLPLRTIEDKPTITTLQNSFSNLFADRIGKLREFKLKFRIDEKLPPRAQTARRIPFQLRPAVKSKLEELVNNDIIEKVNHPSRWVSPVVCTAKQNNELRMCVDMRAANEAIIRERHPIPTVNDMISNLNGSRWFSEIDLRSAFHQIELEETSREITTFATSDGLYRFKRLFFGINCAPEIFQRIMEQLVEDLSGVEVYIDNFLVYGKNLEEHNKNLFSLLRRLEETGLTINPTKCKIAQNRIQFMGHEITQDGVRPLRNKIEAIENFRVPQTKTELSSFLGLVGFCSRFIPEYSTLTAPLRDLVKKNVPFHWNRKHEIAFNKLKKILAHSKTLGFFNPTAKSTIIADASPYGLGAVLIQLQNEEYKIIEFASRALTVTEQKYSQTEKEALSIVWSCERFHQYVYGSEFDIITDHKPLQFIFSPRSKPCARVERWVMRLMGYRFKVIHKPGKLNIADPLSRLSVRGTDRQAPEEDHHVIWVLHEATPRSMNLEEIREKYKDSTMVELKEALQQDKWPTKFRKYEIIKTELCIVDGIILRGTRILIPPNLRSRVLQLAHEGHQGIVKTKQRLRTKVWWFGLDKDVEKYCKSCHGCQLVSTPDPPEPLRMTRIPEAPWRTLAIDFLGPLQNDTYILLIIDYYSRYCEARAMKTITSEKTIEVLEDTFARYGLPEELIADNGTQLSSTIFRDFCIHNGINLKLNTPKWAQANGEVERQNRSLLKRLRIAQTEKEDLKSTLRKYLFAYHTTPHCTTGKTPAFLMFGRELRDKLPTWADNWENPVNIEVRDRDTEQKGRSKLQEDKSRHSRPSEISVGDEVLLRRDTTTHKLQTPFYATPCRVTERNGNSLIVQTPTGRKVHRNTTYVKRYEDQFAPAGDEEQTSRVDQQEEDESPTDHPEPPRRSERNRGRPQWLDDFVTMSS